MMWVMDWPERMYVLDAGEDSVRPQRGGGALLISAEEVMVGASPEPSVGSIEVVIADHVPPAERGLVLMHSGSLTCRDHEIRVTDYLLTVLWAGTVTAEATGYSIWVDDLEEPEAIWFQIEGVVRGRVDIDAYDLNHLRSGADLLTDR